MDAIWVLIFIGWMIYKAMQKTKDYQNQQPRDRGPWDKTPREDSPGDRPFGDWDGKGLPPIFGEVEFPWDEEETPAAQPVPEQRSDRESLPEKMAGGRKEFFEPGRDQGSTEGTPETELSKAGAAAIPQTAAGAAFPLFDTGAVVNGIIFSEVLKPPRCRQKP